MKSTFTGMMLAIGGILGLGILLMGADGNFSTADKRKLTQIKGDNSMANKPKFPVAKVREDGTPAIWLTHTNWLLIRSGLVREYLNHRNYEGSRKARLELSQHDVTDLWPFAVDQFGAALELYQIGWDAWCKGREFQSIEPAKLIILGDQHEAEGYENEIKHLQADPPTVMPPPELLRLPVAA